MTTRATNQQENPPPKNGSNPGRHGAPQRVSLLGIDEVASWLGVEAGFIRRLIAERRIPFVKIGKYVRFDPGEVAGWIDAQRVQPESSRTRHRENSGALR